MKYIRGRRAGGGWGGCWGWVGSGRDNVIHKEANSSAGAEKLPHLVGRDSRQQQFDIPSRLISAHHWPHRPCSGLSWLYRVGKRLPVKADLAIYSPINGVSGMRLSC